MAWARRERTRAAFSLWPSRRGRRKKQTAEPAGRGSAVFHFVSTSGRGAINCRMRGRQKGCSDEKRNFAEKSHRSAVIHFTGNTWTAAAPWVILNGAFTRLDAGHHPNPTQIFYG